MWFISWTRSRRRRLCHALVVVRLNVLFFFFFFFFNLSFTNFNFAGGESPHLLSDSRIERSSQTKRKQVCGHSMVDKKKKLWFRIRLRDSQVTPAWYFFQAMISNLCHQKSVKKVKVKAIFFSRWSNSRRLRSLLYRRSQLSRVCH